MQTTKHLQPIWDALFFYRDNAGVTDADWDDICYAMAVIYETLEQTNEPEQII